ncbi:unnamed protein product [Cercospora beticola]|nr:unnamed protein product [Cercospora beticola]
MGIQPSKTELYLPSQTLRECHPDRCWCDRPYHRSSRYVHVERGGDGRERYQDPVDMFSSFLMGAGPAPQMPWKDPRSWTVRDYEKLGEVMEEWASREYGKNHGSSSRGGGNGGSGYPPWPGMSGGGGGYWDGEYGSGAGRHHGGRRSRRYVPWDQFEDLKSNFHQMAEQYQRHMSEQDAFLFGSDTDRRKEQYRQNMLNQLKEMMPQLAQMMYSGGGMAQQQQQQFFPRQQMPGMMPNPMMPCTATGGTMPGMGMAGVAPTVGCGMPATPMPDPMQAAAMMNGMMNNPMAAAAMQQQSMTPAASMQMGVNPSMMNGGAGVVPPMMNNGMMMNGMMDQQQPPLPPANMSRRARRRNFTAYDDGFDDDYDDFRPRRAGFRRRRDWRDDGDMLGGYTGDMRGPRGPMPGGSGPHRPAGGMVFDDDVESLHANMGAGHGNGPLRAQPTYPHDAPPTHLNGAATAASNFSPPLRRPDYNAADAAASADAQQHRSAMYGADTTYAPPMEAAEGMYTRMAFQARAGAADSAPDMEYGGLYPAAYGMGGVHSGMAAAAPYASASTGPGVPTAAAGPSTMRSAMKRTVSFDPGVPTETPHLTRPRQEESARGEANAGAPPDPRDGLGKSKGI